MRRNLEGTMNRSRGLNQYMQGQNVRVPGLGRRLIDQLRRPIDVGQRFDFGNHHVAQGRCRAADDDVHVLFKRRMMHRMHPHRNPGSDAGCYIFRSCLRLIDEGYNHIGVIFFTTNRSAIFTVQRHVKHAGAELFRHFSLQSQALAHPRLHAAVVVAHRQKNRCRLSVEENFARMPHKPDSL